MYIYAWQKYCASIWEPFSMVSYASCNQWYVLPLYAIDNQWQVLNLIPFQANSMDRFQTIKKFYYLQGPFY